MAVERGLSDRWSTGHGGPALGPHRPSRALGGRSPRGHRLTLAAGVAVVVVVAIVALPRLTDRRGTSNRPPTANPVPATEASSPGDGTGVPPPPSGRSTGGSAQRLGLASGERAVTLAWPTARPPVAPGDVVELVAVSLDSGGAPRALPVAPAARVLALDDSGVTLAVPADRVQPLLASQGAGAIELVITP